MADDGPHDAEGHLPLPTLEELKQLKSVENLRPNRGGGRKTGPKRPVAFKEDRRWVPAALRHWRRVHGLSQRQAAVRIGYAPTSNIWFLWETGKTAPPYETLLRIVASTGIVDWSQEADRRALVDPTLRMEVETQNPRKTKRIAP